MALTWKLISNICPRTVCRVIHFMDESQVKENVTFCTW